MNEDGRSATAADGGLEPGWYDDPDGAWERHQDTGSYPSDVYPAERGDGQAGTAWWT